MRCVTCFLGPTAVQLLYQLLLEGMLALWLHRFIGLFPSAGETIGIIQSPGPSLSDLMRAMPKTCHAFGQVEASFDWYEATRRNPQLYAQDFYQLFIAAIYRVVQQVGADVRGQALLAWLIKLVCLRCFLAFHIVLLRFSLSPHL